MIDKGKHIIDQTELTVSLRPPVKKLPPDPCRLHIKGLSEKTTPDGLLSFMEVASGLDVLNVEFGTQNSAVVTFDGTPGNKLFSFCKCYGPKHEVQVTEIWGVTTTDVTLWGHITKDVTSIRILIKRYSTKKTNKHTTYKNKRKTNKLG